MSHGWGHDQGGGAAPGSAITSQRAFVNPTNSTTAAGAAFVTPVKTSLGALTALLQTLVWVPATHR